MLREQLQRLGRQLDAAVRVDHRQGAVGFRLGLVTLIASNLLNLITCAAELAGIAILLNLLTGWPQKLLLIGSGFALALIVFLLRF